MIFLADLDLDRQSTTEAKKWLELASKYDEPYAVYMLSMYKMGQAYKAEENLSELGLENVKTKWSEVYNYCSEICEYFYEGKQVSDKINYAEAVSRLKESVYKLAVYKFFTGENEDDILPYLVDVENPKVAVLRGILLFNKAGTQAEYSEAANLMMPIFDESYIEAEKTDMEHELFAHAVVNLSKCCNFGLGLAADVNMAVSVLEYGKNYIKTENGLNKVCRELNLYRHQGSDDCKYLGEF